MSERLQEATTLLREFADRPWNENALYSEYCSDKARALLSAWDAQDALTPAVPPPSTVIEPDPAPQMAPAIESPPTAVAAPPNEPTPVDPDPAAASTTPEDAAPADPVVIPAPVDSLNALSTSRPRSDPGSAATGHATTDR